MDAIWDLDHLDPLPNPVAHARNVAKLADPAVPLWLCPVNEPSLYPTLCGMPRHDAVMLALTIAEVARDHRPDVRILPTDPINGIGDRQFEAADALVASGLVDVVGVNNYRHTARTSPSKVLMKTSGAIAFRSSSQRRAGMTGTRSTAAVNPAGRRPTGSGSC